MAWFSLRQPGQKPKMPKTWKITPHSGQVSSLSTTRSFVPCDYGLRFVADRRMRELDQPTAIAARKLPNILSISPHMYSLANSSSLVLGMLQLILRVQLILFKFLSAIRTVHVVAQRVFMHLEVTTAAARIAFAADKTCLSRKRYCECLDAHLCRPLSCQLSSDCLMPAGTRCAVATRAQGHSSDGAVETVPPTPLHGRCGVRWAVLPVGSPVLDDF